MLAHLKSTKLNKRLKAVGPEAGQEKRKGKRERKIEVDPNP